MLTRFDHYDKAMLAGASAMALGTFLPIIQIPIIGTINYLSGGRGDGIFVLGLSVAIVGLVVLERQKLAGVCGLAAFAIMVTSIVRLLGALSKTRTGIPKPPGGFEWLEKLFMQSIGLGWGWLPLFGGALAVIIAAFMRPRALQGKPEPVLNSPNFDTTSADETVSRYIANVGTTKRPPTVPHAFGKRH